VKPDEALLLPRLSESADPVLSSSVADLRAHQPDVAQLASLASRLALQGVAVAAPTAVAATAASKLWKKWALVGGGAASGAALMWLVSGEPTPAPGAAPSRQGSPAREVAASRQATSTPSSLVGRPVAPPMATVPAHPESAVPALTASERAVAIADAPRATVASGAPVERERSERSPAPAPPSVAPRARTAAAAGATETLPGPLTGSASAPTEIELLRDARLALKQSPGRALELTEAHSRAFPGGKLTQERELIAISALVALGRRTAALSRANHFNDAFPESPYRKQIGALLR